MSVSSVLGTGRSHRRAGRARLRCRTRPRARDPAHRAARHHRGRPDRRRGRDPPQPCVREARSACGTGRRAPRTCTLRGLVTRHGNEIQGEYWTALGLFGGAPVDAKHLLLLRFRGRDPGHHRHRRGRPASLSGRVGELIGRLPAFADPMVNHAERVDRTRWHDRRLVLVHTVRIGALHPPQATSGDARTGPGRPARQDVPVPQPGGVRDAKSRDARRRPDAGIGGAAGAEHPAGGSSEPGGARHRTVPLVRVSDDVLCRQTAGPWHAAGLLTAWVSRPACTVPGVADGRARQLFLPDPRLVERLAGTAVASLYASTT